MTHEEERICIIEELKKDMPAYGRIPVPKDEQAQKDLLRTMMNVRMPSALGRKVLDLQESYMRKENILKGIVDVSTIEPCQCDPRLAIWQGDITRLKADAIVNAANSGMTGCYEPLHNCIDNAIHTAAGIRLRLECADIMRRQGYEEPTGQAKITGGYALPAKHVIHTVGPIVAYGMLTDEHRTLLKSCYKSCMEAASLNGLKSIAFCCISTGVFMFPPEEAARIAVSTVKDYLESGGNTSVNKVIFNVFSDRDRVIYEGILNTGN